MFWDVVEVKPERDYCLFLRFKDGLAGRVQLRQIAVSGANPGGSRRRLLRIDRGHVATDTEAIPVRDSAAIRDIYQKAGSASTSLASVIRGVPRLLLSIDLNQPFLRGCVWSANRHCDINQFG
jgi:hypothetical protein